MKVKRLSIQNIGMIANTKIELDKSLILFYGDLMQGKTTILNAVKYAFGGSYPSDIIRHGQTEASVTLEFEGGSISREWYKGKKGETNDRPITFIRDGKPVKKPVDEIKKFLNPFLLDQDYLRKMTETERKTYFAQLFAVDTSEIDKQMGENETKAKDLRAKIKGYGEIDLAEIKPIDSAVLKQQLGVIREGHRDAVRLVEEENDSARTFNAGLDKKLDRRIAISKKMDEIDEEIKRLNTQKSDLSVEKINIAQFISNNPPREIKPLPNSPDTSSLEAQISEAAANQVRLEQYQKNLKRAEEKKADETKLESLETSNRSLKKQKIGKLSKISETCGIKELSFDETGIFIYQGTQAGMLSTSQIMKLSSELSALYPEGLGIDLIDRGESLGKSIFLFVDRAEKEKKTILATIVGEKPAIVPENIGVFVVEKGEVKP